MEAKPEEIPRETEVKFTVSDRRALEERLRRLGAVPGATDFEVNTLLDDPAGTLRTRGVALRVREVGGKAILTFKGPKESRDGVRTRVEVETAVDAARTAFQLLRGLGYAPAFRYEKRRTTWRFQDPGRPLVVVDETPIGLFSEIEGEERAIRVLASELGVSQDEFLDASYVSIYLAAREKDGSLPPDMVFR